MKKELLIVVLLAILPLGAQALEVRKKAENPAPTPLREAIPSGERSLPPDERPFANDPEALGISIEGLEEPVAPYTFLSVTFPSDMVSPDRIDVEGSESPLVFWPPLNVEFTWRTTTSGDLMVKGPVVPGQDYKVRLREGLAPAGGDPFPEGTWGAEMQSRVMAVEDFGYWERSSLNSRPQARIQFNYPVDLKTAAAGAWFQDRATRERFPAEVLLNVPEGESEGRVVNLTNEPLPEKVYMIRFRPEKPLPVGRFYDLIVDGVRDEYAGRTLPYPEVFPLGPTKHLEVDYVQARNFPLSEPEIHVKFTQSLEGTPLPSEPLKIDPPVGGLTFRKDGQFLIATGRFETPGKYKVTISDQITGLNGYTLKAPSVWGATFGDKGPAVIFPEEMIRQRTAGGLRFPFYQVNTGPLTWKAAPIAVADLARVKERLFEHQRFETDENGEPLADGRGLMIQKPTEPLFDAFGLQPAASGEFPASGGDVMQLREILWQPDAAGVLSGPVLVEVTGKDADGRLVGNRALVFFGDLAIVRKEAPGSDTLRVIGMADGRPVENAEVALYDKHSVLLGKETTGADGTVTFPGTLLKATEFVQARAGELSGFQPLALSERFPGAYSGASAQPAIRAYTFTDRPLYRPGQTVRFKGFVRDFGGGSPAVPPRQTVTWQIQRWYGNDIFGSGEVRLDDQGGWSAEWEMPEDFQPGEYNVSAVLAGEKLPSPARFQIEEFRNPPFSVICETGESTTPGEAVLQVSSQYFHGAANAGARVMWKAVWYSDSEEGYLLRDDNTGMVRVDLNGEKAPRPAFMAEASGETALDSNGQVVLRCTPPFPDPGNRAYSGVFWRVDVTGPDGQTLTGGTFQQVPMENVLIGVKALDPDGGQLHFEWDILLPFEEGPGPSKVKATLFQISTKSVKERLAPNVYRYRNFDEYRNLASRDLTEPGTFSFPATEPGRYVIVLVPDSGQPGMKVSTDVFLEGEGESYLPVESEMSAKFLGMTSNPADGDRKWKVGETAALNLLTPTEGVAWVTVETDRILDSFTIPLSGNSSRIEVPVKAEYEPNAFVSVYVLRPGGPAGLAGEMYGSTNLLVEAPDRNLDVTVSMDQKSVEPRGDITGAVKVFSAGAPVAGADLAIYAVDDSILELGGWSLPAGIASQFFLPRNHAVVTYSALKAYVENISPSWLTSKGFVVGDGGEDEFGNVGFTRKDFQPLILWLPSVKTDSRGAATFRCKAPDNLTRFRFIAVGQTQSSQFGAGSETVEVTKSLTIDPALPRFVRDGDVVELRAVLRQKVRDSGTLKVRCRTSGKLELAGDATVTLQADKNAPAVAVFRAKATGVGEATVGFDAVLEGGEKLTDSVEVVIPVDEPVILVRESVGGPWSGGSMKVSALAPQSWAGGRGDFSFAISTTPWLSKLLGIPYLLEYPHGCFEQKASRLLLYTNLARLLEYLPETDLREDAYGEVITATLEEFENSLLANGMLPYWSSGTTPNLFVTLQAAWCVLNAEEAGIEVPARLAEELPSSLQRILEGRALGTTPTLQAFAFFMMASAGWIEDEPAESAAASLYLIRDRLTAEGRAMLALGMHAMDIQPDSQRQLVAELPSQFQDITFNPETFSSATRTEALCTWARLMIEPGTAEEILKNKLLQLMESSWSLSTQENLWLLVAFNALLDASEFPRLRPAALRPRGGVVSENKTSAVWDWQPLQTLADFAVSGLPAKADGSWVVVGLYRGSEVLTGLVGKGMRIERVVKNLTDSTRNGSEEAPFQLGDEILISYRFSTENRQSYVALEDLLPGSFEVLNPNLELIAKTMDVPQDDRAAQLSHSEMRDRQTNLYFDDLPSGASSYAVLARVTSAGTFIWPATQIVPMYDSRFFGRSPSSMVHVRE